MEDVEAKQAAREYEEMGSCKRSRQRKLLPFFGLCAVFAIEFSCVNQYIRLILSGNAKAATRNQASLVLYTTIKDKGQSSRPILSSTCLSFPLRNNCAQSAHSTVLL